MKVIMLILLFFVGSFLLHSYMSNVNDNHAVTNLPKTNGNDSFGSVDNGSCNCRQDCFCRPYPDCRIIVCW